MSGSTHNVVCQSISLGAPSYDIGAVVTVVQAIADSVSFS